MEAVKEKKIGDYLIKIFPDDTAESPDTWGDDGKFLVFDHNQFSVERKGFDPREIFENNGNVTGYYVFQCYAYIHSGVSLSVGDHNFPDARWDVSSTGYWIIKREKGTWKRIDALKVAKELCNVWNQYLSGDVYGFKIFKDEEEIDSCWGYYRTEAAMEEAESLVEYYQK